MKKTVRFLAALIAMLPCLALAEQPVYFPDPNLKRAVEIALNKQDPTPTDMLLLKDMTWPSNNAGIKDLEGLQYAENLKCIWLHNNAIEDITPLSSLVKLESLSLGNNNINDISALAGLNKLISLQLSTNMIYDISSLRNLRQLWKLYLNNNKISDITPVSNLTNLIHLTLHGNEISDVSPLAKLENLEWLTLYQNWYLSDISSLGNLVNLHQLNVGFTQVADIETLTGLSNLTSLCLYSTLLNEATYQSHIPLIQQNNPGILLQYDPQEWYALMILIQGKGEVKVGEGHLAITYSDNSYNNFNYHAPPSVPIEAIPAPGYTFGGWSGMAVDAGKVADSYSASTTVVVDAKYTLLTNFIPVSQQRPIVLTEEVTNVTETSAILHGSIADHDGQPYEFRFRYKIAEANDYVYTPWTGFITTSHTFSKYISDLTPGTCYYFSAQARNSAGESDWGNEMTFTTITDHEFNTPISDKALIIAPFYSEGFVEHSENLVAQLRNIGYQCMYKTNENSIMTIEALDEWLDENYGIIHIASHGSGSGVAVEKYLSAEDGSNRLNELAHAGYDIEDNESDGDPEELYLGYDKNASAHIIGITGEFVRNRAKGDLTNALVFFESCWMGFASWHRNTDIGMIDAFLEKNIGAYVGFDNEVLICPSGSSGYGCRLARIPAGEVTEEFYGYLCEGESVESAVARTGPANGELCPGISDPGCVNLVGYYGNPNLRILQQKTVTTSKNASE